MDALNSDWDCIHARVGFVKASGVRHIATALEGARKRGATTRFLVGVDGSVTSAAGVRALHKRVDELHLLRDPRHLFHPKTWLFQVDGRALLLLGSANLTESALWTNYEDLAVLDFDPNEAADRNRIAELTKQFNEAIAAPNSQHASITLIDRLAEAGLVIDESSQRQESRHKDISDSESAAEAGLADLFPAISVPAPPAVPRLPEETPDRSSTGAGDGDRSGDAGTPPAGHPSAPTTIQNSRYKVFVLRLGKRDVGSRPGFSPDVFLPLAAYRHEPTYWGQLETTETAGSHFNRERRVEVEFHRAGGKVEVASRRLYLYETKSEFRLNTREIHEDAREGDLLQLEIAEPGHGCEYIARVIHSSDSAFAENDAIANNEVAGSDKRWGYN